MTSIVPNPLVPLVNQPKPVHGALQIGDLIVPLQDGEHELWRGPYVPFGGLYITQSQAKNGCCGCLPSCTIGCSCCSCCEKPKAKLDLVVIITERRVIIGRTSRTHTPHKDCLFYLCCLFCCYHDVVTKDDSLLIIDASDIKGAYVNSVDITDKANCMLCCGEPAIKTKATTVRLQLHNMTAAPLRVAPEEWGCDGQTIDGIVVEAGDVNLVLGVLNRVMAAAAESHGIKA